MLEKSELAKESSNGLEIQHLERSYPRTDAASIGHDINEKRLLFKIDCFVVTWLAVMCIMMDTDRTVTISGASYGLLADLGLSENQYTLCVGLFYVSYCLFQVPSVICMRLLGPNIWLPVLMILWAIMTICHGLVENFAGLLAVRLALGVCQAGMYSGAIYCISTWYKRDEVGYRVAMFISTVTIGGSYGPILVQAVANMGGLRDRPAWSWIFIMPGSVSGIQGLCSFFLVQGFPESARFISDHERKFVLHRLQSDGQLPTREDFRWESVRKGILDYKTWLSALFLIGTGVPIFSFGALLTSLIAVLGHTGVASNLLFLPVYLVAGIFCFAIGYASDRLGRRGYFCIGLSVITAASYILLVCSRKAAVSYFAIYIAQIGTYSSEAILFTWLINNVDGGWKRAISIAFAVTIGKLTGIVASNETRSGDAIWYSNICAISLGFAGLSFVAAIALQILLKQENERRDRGERDEVIAGVQAGHPSNGYYNSVEEARKDKADEWSGYRYIL